jgi:hypothetical protein
VRLVDRLRELGHAAELVRIVRALFFCGGV